MFPGLWLDPTALMSDDFETLLDVLQRGGLPGARGIRRPAPAGWDRAGGLRGDRAGIGGSEDMQRSRRTTFQIIQP